LKVQQRWEAKLQEVEKVAAARALKSQQALEALEARCAAAERQMAEQAQGLRSDIEVLSVYV
jgi:hypothetical protein